MLICTGIPTSVIDNLRIEEGGSVLRWNWPENCTTITGVNYWTRIKFEAVSDVVRRSTHYHETTSRNLDLSLFDFIPGVKYNVRAYVIRSPNGIENRTNYVNLTWTTPRGKDRASLKLGCRSLLRMTFTVSKTYTSFEQFDNSAQRKLH